MERVKRENYGLPYWQHIITDKLKIKQSWWKRLRSKMSSLFDIGRER